LLTTEKHITPGNLEALEKLREAGVLMVPVTGRPAKGLPEEVLALPELRYVVTSNGATIRDLTTGETLLEKHLGADKALEVLEASAHFAMIREAFREGVGYLSREDFDTLCARYAGTAMLDYVRESRRVLPGTVAEFLAADGRPVEELFFLTDSPQTKRELYETLRPLPDIGFADPFPNDLEVIAGGIDKGKALDYLLRRLGISPEETLAIGDGGSDLPMLRLAGVGVAMANGEPHVREGADYITDSNQEDGVAKAIHKFVFGV
jgi:hypothetical protein